MMLSLILMVSILQWNACSLIANGQEFKKCIKDFDPKPDVLCIQKTCLKPCLDFNIAGYNCLRKDRINKSRGGCATFIKEGFQYKRYEYDGSLECLITEVWCTEGKFHIVNCYNPPNPLMFSELEEVMEKTGSRTVWVGDFNAHNPLWGRKGIQMDW